MNRFEWDNPHVLSQAARAGIGTVADAMLTKNGQPRTDAVIAKAGGIDLLDLMKEGLLAPRCVVNLREIPELGRIVEGPDGSLHIGAMVTLEQLAAHPLVRNRYGALAQAAGQSASPQIRQVATIGGNLLQRPRCWYFRSLHHHCLRKGGDACFAFAGENQYHAIFGHNGCAIVHPSTSATALVAFNARVELIDAKGAGRVMALESFFLTPEKDIERENDLKAGEILTGIVLPPVTPGVHSLHLRQGEQDSFDWPIADVAIVMELGADGICRRASLVLGSAAPVPYRAGRAESFLTGKRISEESANQAASAAVSAFVPLARNAYKLPVFEALVRRSILSTGARS